MSIKSRLSRLELTTDARKVKPYVFGKGHVGRTPAAITGMLLRAEKLARGEIPFDSEAADELAFLDRVYAHDGGYLASQDKFKEWFEANY